MLLCGTHRCNDAMRNDEPCVYCQRDNLKLQNREAEERFKRLADDFAKLTEERDVLKIWGERADAAAIEAIKEVQEKDRLNDDYLRRMKIFADAADEFCNALEAADGKNPETAKAVAYWRQRFGEFKVGLTEKRIQPSQNEPSGRREGPPDYSDTGNENASQR